MVQALTTSIGILHVTMQWADYLQTFVCGNHLNHNLMLTSQAGYVTAWNNLGNAYEKLRQPEAALEAYEETLSYAPDNEIAKQRAQMIKARLERLSSY